MNLDYLILIFGFAIIYQNPLNFTGAISRYECNHFPELNKLIADSQIPACDPVATNDKNKNIFWVFVETFEFENVLMENKKFHEFYIPFSCQVSLLLIENWTRNGLMQLFSDENSIHG